MKLDYSWFNQSPDNKCLFLSPRFCEINLLNQRPTLTFVPKISRCTVVVSTHNFHFFPCTNLEIMQLYDNYII